MPDEEEQLDSEDDVDVPSDEELLDERPMPPQQQERRGRPPIYGPNAVPRTQQQPPRPQQQQQSKQPQQRQAQVQQRAHQQKAVKPQPQPAEAAPKQKEEAYYSR